MRTVSPALVASVLRRKHPEFYQTLEQDISSTLPEHSLHDVAMLHILLADFCHLLQLGTINWKDSRQHVTCTVGDTRKQCRVTELREMLLGVLLLYYHPERLYQLQPGPIKSGLLKQLTLLLGVDKATLSLNASNAITYFKAYKQFTDDVLHLYHQLNHQHHYFENYGRYHKN